MHGFWKDGAEFMKYGILALGLTMFTACSGQQQTQDENLETTEENNNSGNNLGGDDAGEGNGQENLVQESSSPNDLAGDGAELNSATANDTAPVDATLNGGMPPANPAESAPTNMAAASTPATAPAPASAAVSADGQVPIPGGRVRYVKEGGVQAFSAPNGSPVATLEQGEHPVTWEENGWIRIATGMYVPADSMSNQGVGRPQSGKQWMQ